MDTFFRAVLMFVVMLSTARAETVAEVLQRFRVASGADTWSEVTGLAGKGTLAVGGMQGSFESLEDLRLGLRASRYDLGALRGAEGYDGNAVWTQDPGGEVEVADTPNALRRAATERWLTQRAYWFPQRAAASYGPVEERRDGEADFHVFSATPAQGNPIELWFERDSDLLVRSVGQEGRDTVTTRYADWREIGKLRLPFHISIDRGDPRSLVDVKYTGIATNPAMDKAAFAAPVMKRDTARISGGTTQIPFELINNHIFVEARVDGKPLHMLVDTGGVNVLAPAAAQRLGLAAQGKMQARGVGEQSVDLALAKATQLQVVGLQFDQPGFYVIDLGALADVEGVAVDGIIGYEVFRRFGVEIDYAARRLTLSEPQAFVPPTGVKPVAFELADRTPIVQAQIDGLPARITIDTGSRASLTLHSPFARQHDLARRHAAAPEAVTGWGVGGAARTRPLRLPALQLGEFRLTDLAADIYTGEKGAFADPEISANLGGGVLRRFTVVFDYEHRSMYLTPNADFAKVDEFDRSGLWLMRDGTALRVGAVAPNSAAQRAGIKVDQRISHIDGEGVDRRSLNDWRERLRGLPAGTELTLSIGVGDVAKTVRLRLADRIPPSAARSTTAVR